MPERSGPGAAAIIDARRVAELIARDVPMTWMRMWPGGFPRYLAGAHGARLATTEADVDPHTEIFAAAADTLLA